MFRFLVSTILFAAFLCASSAFAGDRTECKTHGYSIDTDPNGLNVRAGPGPKHKIIARLKRVKDAGHDIWPEFEITGSEGSWLRISNAVQGLSGDTIFHGNGWVHSSRVATVSKGYDSGFVTLRSEQGTSSNAVIKVPRETEIGIRGCDGGWVFGEYKNKLGWLAPQDQCGTPATTCN